VGSWGVVVSFPHSPQKQSVWGGGGGLPELKHVFRISLQILFEIFLSIKELREILSHIHLCIHVKYTSFSSGLKKTSIFSIDFQKNAQNI